MSNLDYAAVAEISGWSPVIAPEAVNCQAPDTGNMETLHLFATPERKQQWLEPLFCGEIRSAFAMTEPGVASSDATNITTRMVRDDDDYVINGRKWWIQRGRRPALPGTHRDGQDRPGSGHAPAAVDDPRAPGRSGDDHRAAADPPIAVASTSPPLPEVGPRLGPGSAG